MTQVHQVLPTLTKKQREVLALLGEGRTGKEIAGRLGVSESAVIQRIEGVRAKFDGATRQELGRIWREHSPNYRDCKELTGKSFQLPDEAIVVEMGDRNDADTHVQLADSATFLAEAPWECDTETRIVPEVLDGENAATFRWLYVVGAALGMACLLLVLLAVSHSVSEML